MRHHVSLVSVAVGLLLAACTDAASIPSTSAPATAANGPASSFAGGSPPLEFTEFTPSTACDPDAAAAGFQVAQAFVTAYNDRDESRLVELASPTRFQVDDLSGIPHLGVDQWDNVSVWARQGWDVDDSFRLIRLELYETGSVFEVERSNQVLAAAGIDTVRHYWKTHSSGCEISHTVLYFPSEDGSSECRFWEEFGDDLAAGTTQDITPPEGCAGS